MTGWNGDWEGVNFNGAAGWNGADYTPTQEPTRLQHSLWKYIKFGEYF